MDPVRHLQHVAELVLWMCTALGTVCGTLYHGEEGLDDTLDGVVKLLEKAPDQLLDWQCSAAYEGAMRVLANVRVHLPHIDLGLLVHGTAECPPLEPSSVEVGAEAKYVTDACKLEEILKRCSGGDGQ